MKIKNHFCIDYHPLLHKRLVDDGINVEVESLVGTLSMIFQIYTDPNEKLNTYGNLLPIDKALRNLYFTNQELENAKWLKMRSANIKLDAKTEDTFEKSCRYERMVWNGTTYYGYYHEKQVKPFAFNPIKWTKNNHFYSSYSGGWEIIFCDDFAKDLFIKQNFKGVSFGEVLWGKKGITLPNAHQIVIDNILPEKAFLNLDATEERFCPLCGRKRYFYNTVFQFKIDGNYLDENQDFYTTDDIFGECTEFPISIVSQRVYSTLSSLGLTRSLNFEPVIVE